MRGGLVDGDSVDRLSAGGCHQATGAAAAAKFVVFETLYDPRRMPGQRVPVIRYPYLEGLRMDEAMNPLAILAVGLYGETLPNQNGAPIRLIAPWKYGFKGIKSIVRMQFVEKQPVTTWMIDCPPPMASTQRDPSVHQSAHRSVYGAPPWRIRRRKTELFNGYGEQVAHVQGNGPSEVLLKRRPYADS